MNRRPDYGKWSKEALIKRIQHLEEGRHHNDNSAVETNESRTRQEDSADAEPGGRKLKPKKRDSDRKIDPSKYSTRLVAFKLAYVGRNYGGFEFQNSGVLPSIEEELWKALVKACLIFPENPEEVRWDDWEYSKCGRTDRGVSAFGQVIAVRVRSLRPLSRKEKGEENEPLVAAEEETDMSAAQDGPAVMSESESQMLEEGAEPAEEKPFDDFTDEIQYCKILNRLLPPDIRILAWCPTTPAGFSARHHCRERQYRYFFTQPAYAPIPQSLENPKSTPRVKDGWLDIKAMREAAKKFEGTHDFRNFCKIDPSKLLTNFDRKIYECDIVEVKGAETTLPYLDQPEFRPSADVAEPGQSPKVYYFHVRGSAFLWHQIRCMVAVIFMVGQGLESPSIIDELLDPVKQPRRPNYVLASEYPLVLWDCVFPKKLDVRDGDSAVDWVYLGEENALNKHSAFGIVDHMWGFWRERKMDEILSGQLLGLVAGLADISQRRSAVAPRCVPLNQRMFEGGDRERLVGKYQPVLQKSRLPTPEDSYDKEAKRKGYANANAWRKERAKKAGRSAAVVDDDADS